MWTTTSRNSHFVLASCPSSVKSIDVLLHGQGGFGGDFGGSGGPAQQTGGFGGDPSPTSATDRS